MRERLIKQDDCTLDARICNYCGNRRRESCYPCADEGKFRSLAPVQLENWEQPPSFTMSEIVDMPAVTRLAVVVLGLNYLQQFQVENTPPLERSGMIYERGKRR